MTRASETPDLVILCDHRDRSSLVRKRVKIAELRRLVEPDRGVTWHVHDPRAGVVNLRDLTCPGIKLYTDATGRPVGFHPGHASGEAVFRFRCGREVVELASGRLQLGTVPEGVAIGRDGRVYGHADKMSALRMGGCGLEVLPYPSESQLYPVLEELRHVEQGVVTLGDLAARLASS